MTNTDTKKGKPAEVWIRYRGTDIMLRPGQKVFELNTDTGLVQEHKLKKVFRWFWQSKKNLLEPVYKLNIQHFPAMKIEDAILEFKIMNADYIRKRKKEGNPLFIHKAL